VIEKHQKTTGAQATFCEAWDFISHQTPTSVHSPSSYRSTHYFNLKMAPITPASDETNHQALLDKLDIFHAPRPFRSPRWEPSKGGRRNKNVRQIISEANRREAASLLATQNNSGSSTPMIPASDNVTTGDQTPAGSTTAPNGLMSAGNIAQATQRLDRLVLERNQQAAAGTLHAAGTGTPQHAQPSTMSVTYTNIESAPSFRPASQRRYCDVTGLLAPYTDPKTRLRYHNKEIFQLVRQLGQSSTEQYLAARGAHVILK
jgi:INO80 complex subunit C